jgi:hypothetical protein
MSLHVKRIVDRRIGILLGAVLGAASCAGRTELTPAPQIGRIAPNAVQALTSGVTMIVRTDAWLDSAGNH